MGWQRGGCGGWGVGVNGGVRKVRVVTECGWEVHDVVASETHGELMFVLENRVIKVLQFCYLLEGVGGVTMVLPFGGGETLCDPGEVGHIWEVSFCLFDVVYACETIT